MFINYLWFIEAWETVFKPFTLKICEVIIFLQIIFERQGPYEGTFHFLHPTTGVPPKLNRIGPCPSLDGRPGAAGRGVGGSFGGTLSFGLKKRIAQPNAPGQ